MLRWECAIGSSLAHREVLVDLVDGDWMLMIYECDDGEDDNEWIIPWELRRMVHIARQFQNWHIGGQCFYLHFLSGYEMLSQAGNGRQAVD